MITIGLSGTACEYMGTIQDVIWLFYPGAELVDENKYPYLHLDIGQEGAELWAEAQFYSNHSAMARRVTGLPLVPEETPNEAKRLARLAVYRVLEDVNAENPSPWGIMTGIRPTKIVHRLMDAGWLENRVQKYLEEKYALQEDKAALITKIASSQRTFLLSREQAKNQVAVYIGIPFCPSRCLYCSFPSYSVKRHSYMVEPFLKALLEEIKVVGETLRSRGIAVQTLYLGGGTPTSLQTEQLRDVMQTINLYLRDSNTLEVTVEGGRPDTLHQDMLTLLAELGVNRLSINPQSMNQRTLEVIGRNHTVEDIYRAVEMARQLKFATLNMDVIIGLPGETVPDVSQTMNRIVKLKPENLTVHALALKRASTLKQRLSEFPVAPAGEAVTMWHEADRVARSLDLDPYYLYRQKQMVANLENIGYALPGHECIYNIQMIEERQTIIGLGVGASSKWVDPCSWNLINEYNAKEPSQYVERLGQYLERKLKHIQHLGAAPVESVNKLED